MLLAADDVTKCPQRVNPKLTKDGTRCGDGAIKNSTKT